MLINKIIKETGLTKKAIEYYTEKGLVEPSILDNSYRDYSMDDLEVLKKIKVLRSLDLNLSEIKSILSENESNIAISELIELKKISIENDNKKKELLLSIKNGVSYEDIKKEIDILEQKQSMNQRLIHLFPGFFGRLLKFQFGVFLNEPISNLEQEKAYENIVEFLDNMPVFNVSEDLERFIEENTKNISDDDLIEMMKNKNQPVYNFDEFLSENDEKIKEYLVYRDSDEYKNSEAFKIKNIFTEFMSTTGFHDIFIKNLRKLSKSYDEYYTKLIESNEKFLEKYKL